MSNATQLSAILEQQYELFDIIKESLDKLGSKATIQRIESRKTALCENWSSFKQNHQDITTIKAALKTETRQKFEEENYFKIKMYRSCEENYLDAIEHMSTMHDQLVKVPNSDGKSLSATSAKQLSVTHNHQLPKLPLPVFNGEFSEWPSFKDSFMAIIGADPSLTCVTKLQFLKGCLVGKAASRLQGVSVTASNFQIAWDDMISYYDNKRLHVDSAVQAIISAKAVNEESSSKLETLFNDINKALGSLEGLGRDVNQWNDVLTHIVSRKLDGASVKEWEKSLGSSTEPPTWVALKEFILTRIRSLEAFERATSGQIKSHVSNLRQQLKAKIHHAAAQPPKQVCFNCQGEHYISSCPGFLSKTPVNRMELIKQLKLCYSCLGPHQINACFSKRRCQKCGGRHHTTIHHQNTFINPVSSLTSNQATSNNNNNSVSAASNVACTNRSPRSTTLLATALVKVVSSFGDSYVVRAFLDQGSEVNLVSEYLINLLQLPRSYTSLSIVGIGGDSSSSHQSKGMVTINLKSCICAFNCSFNAYILSKLTNLLPSAAIRHSEWPHLQNIDLADPEYHQPGRVDLILGEEMYGHGQVLQCGLLKGPEGAPIAQRTTLGWIISGSLSSTDSSKPEEAKSFHCYTDDHLDDLVQKFWMQEESFKSAVDSLTPEEQECEDIFQNTHSRDPEGRFTVRLPFKSVPASFGDSRSPALKILYRMKNRFIHNTEYATNYSNFIAEYEQLGHMQRVLSPTHQTDQMFYLPHHGVLRSCSSTTQLRVVFNGSLKTDKGTSLNDFLHEGRKLQVDLPDVLTRWRVKEFAYCADVTKMFRQVKVHPDDWKYQRILWAEGSNIQEFVLTTVTYGTKSAPFLANRVLNQLADDESNRFPDVKDVIKKNTYVDDVYDGAASVEEGKHRISQIIHLFKAGGFQLKKWSANNDSLITEVPEQNRAPSTLLCIDDGPVHRTLGLNWQPTLDRFIFIPLQQEEPVVYTKRTVLSRTAQLFDPLGWLSPIVVRAKLFIQELWLADLEWDQPITKSFESRWKSYINQLNDLSLISVPRWLGITRNLLSVELHGFSDASQLALGAVVYIRVVRENGTSITILSSKTKVTPTKRPEKSSKRPRAIRVTIPRLELAAALMLTKLVRHFVNVLDLHSVPVHLWTDSSTALYWIQGEPSRWKDFVRNRVRQVQEILPRAHWHHISGEHNPADLPSRGVSPRQLAESDIWWKGPHWLQLTPDKWPNLIPTLEINVDQEERQQLVAATMKWSIKPTWDLLQRYSTLTRLLRITAWCKRFILRTTMLVLLRKSRNPSNISNPYTPEVIENAKFVLNTSTISCPLKPAEIENAKLFWIQKTQSTYFKSEINQLSRLESLSRNSPLHRLTPFVDAQGVLRIGGRLRNAQIDPDIKHPIILPRDSIFSKLVLGYIHQTTLHGGVQLMLATLRRSYWILGGRSYVRSFVHSCVICARHRAATSKQLMGQLPVNRTISSRPFLHSGVDYAGPFILKTWRGRAAKTYKAYLIVFVCFSSSAVHLELATDYSTEGFLAAYKRFVSRRGICATLTSDCGTNLVGADTELRKLFKAASKECVHIINVLANDGTKWQFNPPAAPHFGGKWEAAVKSAKFHIKRTIGESLLTYEEFSTLLAQIEAVLNSRPICPLSDDPEDLEALTPGHFIIGNAINTVPEPSLLHVAESRLSRFQHLRQMLERFWERWSIQYLQRLQEFAKWHEAMPSIKIGTLVLVVDERYPPSKWPLARVIETHPGLDGHVRVVTVKTQSSTLKRPIVKLCPLPVFAGDPSEVQRSNGDVEVGGMLRI